MVTSHHVSLVALRAGDHPWTKHSCCFTTPVVSSQRVGDKPDCWEIAVGCRLMVLRCGGVQWGAE